MRTNGRRNVATGRQLEPNMRTVFAGAMLGLVLAAAPAARADDATEQAVAHVRKLGGAVTRDEAKPGKPVVRIVLAFRTNVTDDDLKGLAPLTEVTELDLQGTAVTPAGLKHLGPLKSLTALNLDTTKMSGPGLKDLAALPKLTALSLYSCSHTEADLKELARVRGLTSLVVSGSPSDLNDAVLKEWAVLKSLRTLKLHGPNITDDGLKTIAGFTELTELLVWFPRKTTPDGWKPLGRLARLRSLSLAGGNDPTSDDARVTDAVLGCFVPAKDLERLELVETGVTDAALATAGTFGKLIVLRVTSSAAVTDAGVKHLAGLKGLTVLKLTGSSVTDAGAELLSKCAGLTVLDLGDTKVTREGAKELRDALPKCEVTWYPRK